jgi:hypothetical protein
VSQICSYENEKEEDEYTKRREYLACVVIMFLWMCHSYIQKE